MKKTWHKLAMAFVATLGLSNAAWAITAPEALNTAGSKAVERKQAYCKSNPNGEGNALCSDSLRKVQELCLSNKNTQHSADACIFAIVYAMHDEMPLSAFAFSIAACEKKIANSAIKDADVGCAYAFMLHGLLMVKNDSAQEAMSTGKGLCKNENYNSIRKISNTLLGEGDVDAICDPYRNMTKK